MTYFIASEIRLEWARDKLDQLESLIQGAINEALKTPVSQSRDDRMKVMLGLNYSITPEARRLVSEYALHARAALDYIIFDLALHNTGAEQEGTQYPIQLSQEKFPWKLDATTGTHKGIGALKHLNPKQVALVERFQPYPGCPLLQVLHELSNRDKHRHFAHIGTTSMTTPVVTPNRESTSSVDKMEIKFHRSFEIILEDGDDATKTLRILQTQLTQMLAAFNKLIEP
jgi:hypothetical protein